MSYLLIFFLDEGRASLYGSPVKPSIQGITYRPISLDARSSRAGQFSIPSHPIPFVILSGPGSARREVPAQSKDPTIHFVGKEASGILQAAFLPVYSGGNNHSGQRKEAAPARLNAHEYRSNAESLFAADSQSDFASFLRVHLTQNLVPP